MNQADKKFVTTKVVAEECGVSTSTVLMWIKHNQLEAIMLPSGHNRVARAELDKFKNSLKTNH